MSQIEKLIKPFWEKVDELLAEQNTFLAEYSGAMTSLVQKGDKVAAITQEVLRTLQTVRERKMSAEDARTVNRPKAQSARAIISNKELSDIEALAPMFVQRHLEIATKARKLHTFFVTEIIPKINALADEISGIASCGDGSMQDFKQQIKKIKDNLSYIARE